MLLYQPQRGEIDATIARALNRLPFAAARLERAAELLASVNETIDYDGLAAEVGGGWIIRSQVNAAVWYRINPTGCACPDHQHHGADPAFYCKHRLAYFAYRRILAGQLYRRLLGEYRSTNDRRRATDYPGALVLMSDGIVPPCAVQLLSSTMPRRVCNVRRSATCRLVPASDHDYARLAEWLYHNRNFEHPEPTPTELPRGAEWQPELDGDQIAHWYKTGSVI